MLSEDEVEQIILKSTWQHLDRGSYNEVLLCAESLSIGNYTGQYVQKKELVSTFNSNPAQAVNKWNMINPQYPALKGKTSWIAPYLGSTIASDVQIAEKVIEIYRNTGLIVVDATAKSNVLVYNGQVICIDVDMAFNRKSLAIYMGVPDNITKLNKFFTKSSCYTPQAISAIKTLMYLQDQFSEQPIDNKYITFNLIKLLHKFRYHNEQITFEILNKLHLLTTISPNGKIFKNEDITIEMMNIVNIVSDAIPSSDITMEHYNISIMYTQLKKYATNSSIFRNYVAHGLNDNQYLLLQRTNNGWTLLHLAAMHGDQLIIKYLLTQNIVRDAKVLTSIAAWAMSAVDLAIYHQHDDIASILWKQGATISSPIYQTTQYLTFGNYMLRKMIDNDDLDSIKWIINQNTTVLEQVDEKNYTLLHYAALHGRSKIVSYLIKQGMNVNQQSKNKANALGLALIKEYANETCQILKNAGAIPYFPNEQINYKTFSTLIKEGDITEIKILVANNPSLIKQSDINGNSLLHEAVCERNSALVLFLVKKGADVNKENVKKCTPLDLATKLGYKELASFLTEQGAFDGAYIELSDELRSINPTTKIPSKIKKGLISSIFNFFSYQPIMEIQKKAYVEDVDEEIFSDYIF